MSNTISKNFKDSEIIGVLYIPVDENCPGSSEQRKVLYLKTGVKRRKYNDDLGTGEYFEQLNQTLIAQEAREKVMKLLYGGDDFEDNVGDRYTI